MTTFVASQGSKENGAASAEQGGPHAQAGNNYRCPVVLDVPGLGRDERRHPHRRAQRLSEPKEEIMQIKPLIAAILLAAVPSIALAQSKPVKIGVLNDQSSVYADSQGIGSVIAARLAVEDYAKNLGLTVE